MSRQQNLSSASDRVKIHSQKRESLREVLNIAYKINRIHIPGNYVLNIARNYRYQHRRTFHGSFVQQRPVQYPRRFMF
jgi:iron-sulfur cluster repair protein YtfE (RIC family)